MKIAVPFVLVTLLLLTGLPSLPSSAATPTEEFSVCLVDSLNGKERKMFARLVFFSMAAHPEIKSYSKVRKGDVKSTEKAIGKVFTRLLTEDCPVELRKASKANPMALQKAFELVGQVAMQELMTNEDVVKTMSGFSEYADLIKIQAAIGE